MMINFILDKISVTKQKEPVGNIEAKNNVKITDITEKKIAALPEKKVAAEVSFRFTIEYNPHIATILLEGRILYMVDEKERKKMLEIWKKEAKVDPKQSQPILNHILRRCNIKALSLANEVNLPPHIPFPRLAMKSEIDAPKKEA